MDHKTGMEWFGIAVLVCGVGQLLSGVGFTRWRMVSKSEDPSYFWTCVTTWSAVGIGIYLLAY